MPETRAAIGLKSLWDGQTPAGNSQNLRWADDRGVIDKNVKVLIIRAELVIGQSSGIVAFQFTRGSQRDGGLEIFVNSFRNI
jgi:hypothetical protein